MNYAPSISVIIPTCYRENMLIDCVASVLAQNYAAFEIIVIDQAPEPRLRHDLASRFGDDQRIRYIHALRAGASRARNIGIQAASSLIVAFIDDDAVAEPGWLQGIAEAFADNRHPALIAGRILPLWEGARPAWYPAQREFLLGLYDIGGNLSPIPPADQPIGANMAGLRQVILDHGGFEEALGPNYFRARTMVTGEDAILGQRIRTSGFLILYQPAATVRHHVCKRKQSRWYFLKRHFWEGVTTVQQMQLLGHLGSSVWPHFQYHGREICLAFARFVLPGYRNNNPDPRPVIRMIALSRVFYSLGVLWGFYIPASGTTVKKECASA